MNPPSRKIVLSWAGDLGAALALGCLATRVVKRTPRNPPVPEVQAKGGFTNSLGMTFIPVPGTDVLWCEHETRVRDYARFAAARLIRSSAREILLDEGMEWRYAHKQTGDHPVVYVSWEDAKAFCAWLSEKEGRAYRLPTDHEWSIAVGIGNQEDPNASPEEKDRKISGYPWGPNWPPPPGYGNFNLLGESPDLHPFTAPVKSYQATHGLFDLSGNVWEWCEDWFSNEQTVRVVRGGSWGYDAEIILRSSYRSIDLPTSRLVDGGFRCVVVLPAR